MSGVEAIGTAGLMVVMFWGGYVARMLRERRELTADE